MNRFLLLLLILLTASTSLCLSVNNITRINIENMSSSSSPCICNPPPSMAHTPPHTPDTDTSMKPAPTSHPTIRNITCNTTLIPDPSTNPSTTNIITTVIFRLVITILSLLNTNFAWRIHGKPRMPSSYISRLITPTAHHAQQRLRLARENLHLIQV